MEKSDGWKPLCGYDQIRYEGGRAVEVRLLVACPDIGRGGHRCSRACEPASEQTYAWLQTLVRDVTGEALSLGERVARDAPGDPYSGWEHIALVR
jgi:hypothetical protein